MGASGSGFDWTLVGVLLTAVFTGLAALMALLLLRHERQLAGMRKPVRLGRRKPVGVHRFRDEDDWDRFAEVLPTFRVLTLYIFNRSAVRQTITFDVAKSTFLWPRSHRGLRVQQREVTLSPHRGGNFRILAGKPLDPKLLTGYLANRPDPWPEKWERRCLIKLSGMTASGRRVRFLGFATPERFTPRWIEETTE